MNHLHEIELYDYLLPDERIARHPLERRDSCRLLVREADGTVLDTRFDQIGRFLPKGMPLAVNDTRVINARLRFRKGENNDGAQIEIFCLEPSSPADYAVNFASSGPVEWTCFVGNSKRWKEGLLTMPLEIGGKKVVLSALRTGVTEGSSTVQFRCNDPSVTFADIISHCGEIPIPPYLNRATESTDSTDYQTVYSRFDGSVAAPTAGLHFTAGLLGELQKEGHRRIDVTLHVGAGTFQPVKVDNVADHVMHAEFISVSRQAVCSIIDAVENHGGVVAVGTTSVRTLESVYHIGCLIHEGKWDGELPQWYPYGDTHPRLGTVVALRNILQWLDNNGEETIVGTTRIIIAPGYDFRIVAAMVTNFHQPRSTLLLLVCAFIGQDWRRIYDHALLTGYRFLSYGDACLFLKPQTEH